LNKVNRELDNFVYHVSHNLRAPLASLLGLLHLAKKKQTFRLPGGIFCDDAAGYPKLDSTLIEILNYSRNNRNEIDESPLILKN